VAILRQLAGSNRPVSAGALARGLTIPRSSIYELLSVLDELGLVAKVGTGYMLGAGVSELGSAYARTNPLQRLAQPIVRQLAESADGTAQLAVLRGWETVYIGKEQAMRSVAVITAAGVRMPAYLTATGRAMLAQLPKREVLGLFTGEREFVNRTGRGPQTVRELNSELAHVRTRGFAVERGEVTDGIWTIGASVLDALDRPVAGIGLCLPDAQWSDETESRMASRVRHAAAELTARLR